MKKIFLLSVLCIYFCSFNPLFSQSSDESTTVQIDIPYDCEEDLIEIMFDWDSQVRLRNSSLVDLKSNALLGLDPILKQFNDFTWFRISDVAEETIDNWSINGERNTGKPVYNLNNIYRLKIPKGLNIWETAAMLEELPGVLLARPVPKPMELPIPPNYQSSQGYLNPASSTPTGIDAAYAWTQTGGTGTGVTICDLEYTWNYNHNDISKAAGSQINTNTADPPPYAGPNHGTAVIGQLVADNNSWGTTGICYGANLKTCGTYYGTPSPSWNVPGAMAVAIASLSAGDIILLEQQWDYDNNSSTLDFLPIEWWLNYSPNAQTFNGVYAAITNAISNGIHVVEAGGNGAQNTDLLTWYGNSGAIIVGAGGAYTGGTYPYGDLQKLWFSSYGSRFDLQGWGENVVTTGYGDLYNAEGTNYWYTNTFSGTSSASPIVAGALACAEGYYLANVSATPPTPAYMRTHLKTYGTAQVTPPSGNIGPRPNLYAALNNFPPPAQTLDFGDLPDSYLTSLASNGARHLIGNYFLGALVDAEGDGVPSANADSDDNSGSDDEDGVIFTNILSPGGTTNITVTASISGGLLQCWIDFNGNGFFDIPSEEVFLNQPLVAGPNNLSFNTPASAVIGSTYARFRFSSYLGVIFYSYCPDGEVEDYKVDIVEDQGSSLKWEQLPDLSPTGMDVDATWHPDDPDNPPILLADDFLCTETGNITDIHIWGSWINDYLPFFEDPAAVQFTFSIHTDIPDPDGTGPEYSMPGEMLWMRTWIPTYNDIEEIISGPEDWYNPFYPMWLNDNHQMCYKYNYILDPQDYFLQEGTAENPIVYWLDVQAEPFDPDPNCRFGWKTSLDHWNDDAVWIDAIEQYIGPWNELTYPLGHEFETESIDLAFQITTEGGGPTEEYDFGDAPEDALAYPSLGIVGNFPTCVGVPVSGWIEHQTMDLYFGQSFDLENEGNAGLCPSFNPGQYNQDECFADGDAGLIVPDGFTIVGPIGSETVQPCVGTNQHLGYTCSNAMWGPDIDIDVNNVMANGNLGYLNIYVDWNQDGQWLGSSNCPGYAVPEHALVDFIIPNGYAGPVSGLMAAGTTLSIGANPGYVWARFTLTDVPVGSDWDASGSYEDGETEDYLLLILEQADEFDFGDASDPTYPTLLASSGANHLLDGITYLGMSVDSEPDGQQTPFADGDDMDGNDDEDGISFDWPITVGNPCKITVNASVANGLFSGWIDFDGNGSWADPGEHIFADFPLNAGDNDLHFIVPPATAAGLITYARFRFSTQPGLSFTGSAIDGEVEDYEVTIEDFGEYKWAQYPDTSLPGLHAHDYITAQYESIVIADDWLCNGGLVTDIHWWGNYELNAASQELRGGGIDHFHISIHADDPTGTCLPLDPEIYGINVPFSTLVEQNTGLVNLEGCIIYKYDLILSIPFEQVEGTRYWVDISAFSSDPTDPAYWRWQESMRSPYPILCGAVDKINPAPGTWTKIVWPGNPNEYTDMAFIITSEPVLDFGDTDDGPYPTLLSSNGARHILDGLTYLGTSVDAEPDGQPDPMALGDDNDGNDDEDGVTINAAFSNLSPSGLITYDIVASNAGTLNVWIDWDANGTWAEADNHAAINIALVTGNNPVSIGIPATTVIGTTYSRFRFSSVSGLSYTGPAPDGEVEDYELTIGGDVDVNLKVFLEGPFNGTNMNTDLNSNNLIPLGQPYSSDATAPWFYAGTESVPSIPNVNIVDWVMVEFRDAPSPAAATGATMVSQQVAFILNDGSIVSLDGVSPVQTNGLFAHNLYVVIWHRNHLGIMSSGPIVPTGINQYSYDFSGGPGQAYLSGQKNLGGGIYGMAGGDGKPDGFIDNQDVVSIWSIAAGTNGYLMVDYNLDTQVDNQDKNNIWYPNISSGSQIP